jgi:cell division protein FtsB
LRAQLDSGTFGKNEELKELKEQNNRLEREMKFFKDHIKQLMHSFGKF